MAKFDAVFEGGGAKGIAFVGALEVLQQRGHTLRRYIGTSAGAITATLLAAGYTHQEMMDAILERLPDGTPRFSSFMDIPKAESFSESVRANSLTMTALKEVDLPFVPDLLEGRHRDRTAQPPAAQFHLCAPVLLRRMRRLLLRADVPRLAARKTRRQRYPGTDTLADFARKTGADLSVVASDTSDMEMLVLNHRTAPDVPAANAVRMSMSIPFVWEEVVWPKEWGTYRGRPKAGNIIVDGGVLSNFPIRLIATGDDEIRAIMGDTDPAGAGNLGLMIDESLPVPGAPNTAKTPLPVTRIRTVQRLSRLLETMTGAADNDIVRRYNDQICRLPAKGYGTLEFDMQGARLDAFIAAARDAMERHLAQPPAA